MSTPIELDKGGGYIVALCIHSHGTRKWRWIIIKWKHFPRYWPFVRGIHPSPVNSPHKGQWRGALMLSLISARISGWVNNGDAGDLRRHRAHYDVTVMILLHYIFTHMELDLGWNTGYFDCLLNSLFRRRSNKTSKLRVTSYYEENPPLTVGFPSQRASNAENVSIWWHHHGKYKSNVLLCLRGNHNLLSDCKYIHTKFIVMQQYTHTHTHAHIQTLTKITYIQIYTVNIPIKKYLVHDIDITKIIIQIHRISKKISYLSEVNVRIQKKKHVQEV